MKKCCNNKCKNEFEGPGIKCPQCKEIEVKKTDWRKPKPIEFKRDEVN